MIGDVATVAVTVGAGRLEVLDIAGDRESPPLVLLHEGLGSVDLWRGFPADLHVETGRRVVAYSRHGHGRSHPPAQPRTPRFFHDEALQVLPDLEKQLGIVDPVLIGHSDGASIALIHAAAHNVSGLVLLAPHVFVEQLTVAAIRETREAYVAGGLRQRMARYHDDVDAAFWGWCDVWLDPAFVGWNLEREVERVTAPTLLIQGTGDPYGTLEQLHRIEARIADSRRVLLPGGHSPHLEHRTAVLDVVKDFVAGL